jgi:hypothetical protein
LKNIGYFFLFCSTLNTFLTSIIYISIFACPLRVIYTNRQEKVFKRVTRVKKSVSLEAKWLEKLLEKPHQKVSKKDYLLVRTLQYLKI